MGLGFVLSVALAGLTTDMVIQTVETLQTVSGTATPPPMKVPRKKEGGKSSPLRGISGEARVPRATPGNSLGLIVSAWEL